MGFGALVAAIQGSVTPPARCLWVNGSNVLMEAGAPGNLFGVLEDSIEVTERGPGGVSAMVFELRDPGKKITLSEADPVVYQDLVNDRPEFVGSVQRWTARPFGLGRIFTVQCIGLEALLDWMIVPSLALPAGLRLNDAIQATAAQAQGVGVPLRAFSSVGGTDTQGSQATPIARFQQAFATMTLASAVTLTSPTYLRQALSAVIAAASGQLYVAGTTPFLPVVTVDVWFGLRAYDPTLGPTDYAALTVTDAAPGANQVAANLRQQLDFGTRYRSVYVKGGNDAGSGTVSDGSGIPGPAAVLTDATILTGPDRDAAGAAYLAAHQQSARGSLELQGNTITNNVHPGSILTLTDDETGATGSYPVAEIKKRYHATTRDWAIAFGRLPASLPRSIRWVTRAVLS